MNIQITEQTKLGKAIQIADRYSALFDVNEIIEQLKTYPIRAEWRIYLTDIKFKQLIDLQNNIKTFEDLVKYSFKVLLDKVNPLKYPAFEVIAFAWHISNELDKVDKMFKQIQSKPTAEEERAGIKRLTFGFFGTVDWYAQRMGITNHDDVVELKWLIVWQCMKMDFETNQFNERYRKVIERKTKQ